MGDVGNSSKEMQKMVRRLSEKDLDALNKAVFSYQKNTDYFIDGKGIPSYCVIIDDKGDIYFSVSVGIDMDFTDYGLAKHFCEQHVMDCLNNGMKDAKHWKVMPAFVGKPPTPEQILDNERLEKIRNE